jgi:hypothetical protein
MSVLFDDCAECQDEAPMPDLDVDHPDFLLERDEQVAELYDRDPRGGDCADCRDATAVEVDEIEKYRQSIPEEEILSWGLTRDETGTWVRPPVEPAEPFDPGHDYAHVRKREQHDDGLPGADFGRVDLGAIVHGDQPPTRPTLFCRPDGGCLLYPGGRHDIHGEPGHGKSMAAAATVADELANGGRVVVLDYEATAEMFVERGLALGIPADVLDDPARVAYFNPGHMNADEIVVFAKMVEAFDPTLIVGDAVGPAMGRQGLDENDNTQVARWHADFVEPIRAGVTLLLIDHVSRDRQNRQRGGRGGWMKLQLLDVSYTVKAFKAFSRTQGGLLKLACAKDRFGSYAIGEIVAEIHVTPHDNGDRVDFDVRAPDEREGAPPWRPTALMERLSKALERRTAAGDLPDREETLDLIPGRAQYKRQALTSLVAGGYVDDFVDGRHRRYQSMRPYREADDPGPDPGPEPGSEGTA